MSLIYIGLISVVALSLLIYVASMVIQSYLYSEPAEYLPLRSLGAGLILGGFITFWCSVDSRHPGRYDTIFNFSSYDIEDFDTVEAVKKIDQEEGSGHIVRYKRRETGNGAKYFNEENNQEFRRADSEGIVVAIIVRDKVTDQPIQLDLTAKLDARGNLPPGDIQYREVGGKRYMDASYIGRLNKPGTAKVILTLLFNFGLLILWTLTLWLVLRYGLGSAMTMSFVIWLVLILLVMPVLFDKTRKPQRKPTTEIAVPAAVEVEKDAKEEKEEK